MPASSLRAALDRGIADVSSGLKLLGTLSREELAALPVSALGRVSGRYVELEAMAAELGDSVSELELVECRMRFEAWRRTLKNPPAPC